MIQGGLVRLDRRLQLDAVYGTEAVAIFVTFAAFIATSHAR
jgi:hypothetical protein